LNLRSRMLRKWVNKHLEIRCGSCWCTKCSHFGICDYSCEDCERHLNNIVSERCKCFTTVQISELPKQKPIYRETSTGYKWIQCPLCHSRIDDMLFMWENDHPEQCFCGQHLDWSK